MDLTAARWDAEAQNYQSTFKLGHNDYNKALFRFWVDKGMVRPGYRVQDIGCGVGKYGVMFAEYGCDITLTDISPRMIEHVRNNMSRFSSGWRAEVCDFTKAGEEDIFRNGFDFSISTMSPAICDIETVKRMSDLTHGYCFITRFARWEQPSRDRILKAVGAEIRPAMSGMREDCENLTQWIRELGYVPELIYADYEWSDARTAQEQTEYMRSRHAEELFTISDEVLKEKIEELCGENGIFVDEVHTKAAWIFWNTKGEKHEHR